MTEWSTVSARCGILRRIPAVLAAPLLIAGLAAESLAQAPEPEPATSHATKAVVTARKFIAAAANPHAVDAAVGVLEAGGGAIDAAIAAQLVLNLVEPQSSGIGGGGFLLHWDASARGLTSYDGRETAPAGAETTMFLQPDGKPLAFMTTVRSGLSVGTPGLLRMLEMAHRHHGKLPWRRLFTPAITLAEHGFAISPRLHALLERYPSLAEHEPGASLFFTPGGEPKPVGTLLRNPAFAETLRVLAAEGAAAFYGGAIAQDIVQAVQAAPERPGTLSVADLAGYRAKERAPVCAPYRRWRVCGMGPPSSGGIAVLQILGLLERFDMAALAPASAAAAHRLAEASRLAFADRNRYVADADFVAVPVAGLLDRGYLAARAALIHEDTSLGTVAPGDPAHERGDSWGDGDAREYPSTSHLSIVDADGNAVAMTSSIEHAFGSQIMVRGFLLNNQLTDFSFVPDQDGRPVANRIAPGKRPRSSMAPTMVFDADGRLVLVIGTPGGSRIIGFVAQRIVAVLDWGLDIQTAIDLPHILNRNGPTELEAGTAAALAPALERLGHAVQVSTMSSGLHGIRIGPDGLTGGADSRREGVARGR